MYDADSDYFFRLIRDDLEAAHFSKRESVWTTWWGRIKYDFFFKKGHNAKGFWQLYTEFPVINQDHISEDAVLESLGKC